MGRSDASVSWLKAAPVGMMLFVSSFQFVCMLIFLNLFFFSVHATSEVNKEKKRKRTTGKEIPEGSERNKKKKKQYQPNYFISIPITNPEVMFFMIVIWYNQNYLNSYMCL